MSIIDEELVCVPADRSMEAWQWMQDHGGTKFTSESEIERTTQNLDLRIKEGRPHMVFVLKASTLARKDKMMFKLMFAGI